MRVAVNTRLLIDGKMEGTGWFSYEIAKRLVRENPEVEFIFFFDRPFSDKFMFGDNVVPVVLSPPARHPLLYIAWFEWSLSRALKKYSPDVFFSPDGHLSLRSDVPSIPVIHDLNFKHHPEFLPPVARWYYNKYFPQFAQKASRIITVSNHSKNDISSSYGIQKDKIDVVYNGLREGFFPLNEAAKKSVREEYTFGSPYFIYIGALIERKNITGLFRAFSKFKRDNPEDETKLVVVGDSMWGGTYMENAGKELENPKDVIFTGHLNQTDLNRLLSAATALTFVPFFEGFGVPIIEAFATGTPVICSNTTSMPEVAGDAAILVNPKNTDEIAGAMSRCAMEPELRREMTSKGTARSKHFSWDKATVQVWKNIEKVIPS